ncbi:hypothetical protein [Fusibacter sp. JL216-2]|uniref:hypothetical protein n=1 Tax=Fusibacter sp. JL216-2 TaxID=3071453 RepID=UPI003D34A332
MFKWLDKTTNFLLRFVYDSLKVFLLFIMVIRAFDNTFAIEGIFGFTTAILLTSVLVSYYLSKLSDEKREKYRYIGLVGIIFSLLIGIRLGASMGFSSQMVVGGYFIIVWMNGIKFITESDNTHLFFKRFFQTFLIMLFISISVGIGQLRWYLEALRPFYVVFILSVIMNLISMNLKAAYQETAANIMQKSRRVLAFNITSIILLTLSILGLTVFFSSISLGWLEEVVRFVLLPVAQLGAWFSGKIRERALRMKREDASGEFQSWSDRVEEMQEDIGSQSTQNGSSPWDQYIEWAFIIIVIAVLLGFAYYLTKKIEKRKADQDNLEEGEYRESLLTATYVKEKVMKGLMSVVEKARSIFSKDTDELPRIRRLYKTYLQQALARGTSISQDMTPNEVLKKDLTRRRVEKPLKQLTAIYNKFRYGMVEEDRFDKDVLNQIEETIKSHERPNSKKSHK